MHWASGRVLHDHTFRVVAAGEVVSVLGDYAYQVAFAWLVLSVTGSALTLAAVMICNVVPNGLLILVGGAITDRWPPQACDVLLARVTGTAGLGPVRAHAHRLGTYLAVYAVAAAFGLADAFFWPASGSIVPFMVHAGDLPAANAVIAAGEQAAMFAGPLLGGAVMTAFSSSAVLAVNAATFFIAAVTILRAPAAVTPGQHQRRSARGLLASITAGLSYARGAGAAASLPVACSLLAVLGAGVAYSSDVALPAWIQVSTPAEMLGRVNSVISLPRAVLPPASLAVMGALAAASTRLPFYLASLLMLLAGAILALNPAARKLSTQNQAPAPADG